MIELVPVAKIKTDPQYQMRIGLLDQDHLDGLKEALSENSELLAQYPISLANIDDVLTVVDGFHRFQAATDLKFKTVSAKIVATTKHDALQFAARANIHEGIALKRTASDRRKAVESLLAHDEFRKLTNTQLADIVGCSMQTVGNIRNSKPEYACDVRVTKDGKELSSKAAGSGAAARGRSKMEPTPAAPPVTPAAEPEPAPSKLEPTTKPRESDQAVILRLEAEVAEATRAAGYYHSLLMNVWNLALVRRPDLFKADGPVVLPEEILKRVLDSIPAPAPAAAPEPLNGAPSKAAADWLASCLKGKPFNTGKPISDVTSNARKILPKDEIAWLKAELTTRRQCQTVVLESAE
jgi:hypothetical protein